MSASRTILQTLFLATAFTLSAAGETYAQEPFIGEIRAVAFTFAPPNWAECNGQLLPISRNVALFSLLGTTYGGDGRTNFALPDLRGRAPIHHGNGPGLSSRKLGEKGGEERTYPAKPVTVSKSVDEAGVQVSGETTSNMQPFLVVRYIIATQGVYPSRP